MTILSREQIDTLDETWMWYADDQTGLIDTARAYHNLRDRVRALCEGDNEWFTGYPDDDLPVILAALDKEA